MTRTYRVIVRGRFENLDDAQREQLRDAQGAHGMFASRFTPEGTFLYEPELVGYQFRYLIVVEDETPQDADTLAHLHAEEMAETSIRERGLQGRIVGVSADCIEDMPVRKGTRR